GGTFPEKNIVPPAHGQAAGGVLRSIDVTGVSEGVSEDAFHFVQGVGHREHFLPTFIGRKRAVEGRNASAFLETVNDSQTMLSGRKASVAVLGSAEHASVDTLLASGEYTEFAQDDFDSTQYANRVIQAPPDSPFYGMDITTSLAKLSFGIEHLNKHIQEQVTTHYEDLLQQVTGLSRIEEILLTVKQGVGSLNSSFDRVREKVLVPHQEMRDRSLQLERIQTAAEVLRRVLRFMYLLRRPDIQLTGGERELPKAALTIHELNTILAERDLEGIDVIDSEILGIKQATQRISAGGEQLLYRGMQIQNQTDIAAGLQVFYNLGQLSEKVQEVVARTLVTITRELQTALDPVMLNKELKDASSPRRTAGSPLPPSAPITTHLWHRLEALMDVIYENYNKMLQLHRVLKRKRDTATQVLFLDDVNKSLKSDLLEHFAQGLSAAFEKELRMATKASQPLMVQLQNGYPRLLRLVHNVFARLAVSSVSGDDIRSLRRLLEPVDAAFPERLAIAVRPTPTRDDVEKVLRTISSELEAAKFDEHFFKAVSRNASKALKTYLNKCEHLCNLDFNQAQIVTSGTASSAQQQLIEALNCLWFMQEGAWKLIHEFENFSPDESLSETVNLLSTALQDLVEPFFAQITRDLESTIVKIGREDFAGRLSSPNRGASESSTSQYVVEFAGKIRWLHRELLSKLHCGEESREWCRSLGRRVLEYFLRHASLVRPANESVGRLLAGDMTQIEFVMSQWLAAMGMKLERDLADSYKALRAFRHMPFLSLEEVLAMRTSQNVSPIIIIHHCIARAHPAIPFPTMLYAWNDTQYSDWLDLHSQDEAAQILERCLDSYASELQRKRDDRRCPEYFAAMQALKAAGE
ncbi:Conserved oligomeric Golgi complex subunit, partial [Thoreauomyces humboldtii]